VDDFSILVGLSLVGVGLALVGRGLRQSGLLQPIGRRNRDGAVVGFLLISGLAATFSSSAGLGTVLHSSLSGAAGFLSA
jgi:hypothetical protein